MALNQGWDRAMRWLVSDWAVMSWLENWLRIANFRDGRDWAYLWILCNEFTGCTRTTSQSSNEPCLAHDAKQGATDGLSPG